MTLEQEKVLTDFINKMDDFVEILPNDELKDAFIAYNRELLKMFFFHLNPLINEYDKKQHTKKKLEIFLKKNKKIKPSLIKD